jgi:hypothetical protein
LPVELFDLATLPDGAGGILPLGALVAAAGAGLIVADGVGEGGPVGTAETDAVTTTATMQAMTRAAWLKFIFVSEGKF